MCMCVSARMCVRVCGGQVCMCKTVLGHVHRMHSISIQSHGTCYIRYASVRLSVLYPCHCVLSHTDAQQSAHFQKTPSHTPSVRHPTPTMCTQTTYTLCTQTTICISTICIYVQIFDAVCWGGRFAYVCVCEEGYGVCVRVYVRERSHVCARARVCVCGGGVLGHVHMMRHPTPTMCRYSTPCAGPS